MFRLRIFCLIFSQANGRDDNKTGIQSISAVYLSDRFLALKAPMLCTKRIFELPAFSVLDFLPFLNIYQTKIWKTKIAITVRKTYISLSSETLPTPGLFLGVGMPPFLGDKWFALT